MLITLFIEKYEPITKCTETYFMERRENVMRLYKIAKDR